MDMNTLGYFIYMDKQEKDSKMNVDKIDHLEREMRTTYQDHNGNNKNPENIGGLHTDR